MTKAQQDAIRARLAELETKGGGVLTPDMVIADARHDGSPLHAHFEWDDNKAAQAWRLEQARTLIRSVMLVVTTETSTLSVVAYVRHPDMASDEQGYTSTARIRTDKDRAHEVLTDEFSRAAAALRRARELAIVFGLQKDVDIVARKVEKLAKRIPAHANA